MMPILSSLSLMAAVSTTAGEPAPGVDCIIERLSDSEATGVAAEGEALMTTGWFSPSAGALLTPARECMTLNHWTAEQTQLAARYTINKLARPAAEATLRGKGLDPGKLAAIYQSLSAEHRMRPLSRPVVESLMNKAQSAGLVHTDEEFVMMGRYLGLLSTIDVIPVMLACASAPTPPTPDNPFPGGACSQP
jgi:hypothetical protein